MAEPERIGASAVIDDVRRQAATRPADDSADVGADELIARLELINDRAWRRRIPRRFHTATVDDLEGSMLHVAQRWITGGMSDNVLLLGPVGVGKTHAAASLCRAAHDAGRSVMFTPTVELLEGLRPGGSLPSRPERVDILVLDDLGVEKPTDWAGQELDRLINRRWSDGRPIIVTSNLEPSVLAEQVGPRMWSRLYADAIRHTIAGDDRRM